MYSHFLIVLAVVSTSLASAMFRFHGSEATGPLHAGISRWSMPGLIALVVPLTFIESGKAARAWLSGLILCGCILLISFHILISVKSCRGSRIDG